ncbi:hypothetical protein JVU11DRAFT_2549 [Chiua virens]|nr:hypothetical protein JVU11DRAFT_2549 [Chiua virens]
MRAWGKLENNQHHLQPFLKPGLAKAQVYYISIENSPVYLIAMFVDPSVKLNWVSKHWDDGSKTTVHNNIL